MNKLPLAKRVMILNGLCEGVSMRSISRMADVSINTVTKLLEDAGETCLALHDELVRDVKSRAHPVRRDLVVLLRQGQERRGGQGRRRPALATCGRGRRSTPTRS